MLMDMAVKVNLWAGRHKTLLGLLSVAALMLISADYAGFIELPTIVAVPVVIGGVLTAIRYALWEGWLKPEVEARSGQSGQMPDQAPTERQRRRSEKRRARANRLER
jgi:hypothetical protein